MSCVLRLACFLACVAALARDAGCGERDGLEDAVGPNALAFVSVDVDALLTGVHGLEIARLLGDEEVQDYFEPMTKALGSQPLFYFGGAFFKFAHGWGLPDTIGGRVQFTLRGIRAVLPDGSERVFDRARPFGTQDAQACAAATWFPEFCLRVETSGRAAFEPSLLRVLELDPDVVTDEEPQGPFALRTSRLPVGGGQELTLHHGFAGDVFAASTSRAELLAVLERAAGATPSGAVDETLAGDAAFRDWRAAGVREHAVIEAFLATRAAGSLLRGALGVALPDPVRDMQAAGLAIAFEDGRIRQSICGVLEPGDTPLHSALAGLRAGSVSTATVAKGSQVALGVGVDLREYASQALASLPQARLALQQILGPDGPARAVAMLGDGATFSAGLPRGGLVPEFLASIKLRDVAGAEQLLRALAAPGAASALGVTLREVPLDAQRRAFAIELPGVPIAPVCALSGDALLIGSSGVLLKKSLAQDANALAEEDDFARSARTTGGSTQDAVAFFYADVPALVRRGVPYAQALQALSKFDLPFGLSADDIPADAIASNMSGHFAVVRSNPRTIVFEESSSIGSLITCAALGGAVLEMIDPRVVLPPAPAKDSPFIHDLFGGDGDRAYLGTQTEPAPASSDGLRVMAVTKGSPAEGAGIRAEDRILTLDGEKVRQQEDLIRLLALHKPGDEVFVACARGDQVRIVLIRLGRRSDFVGPDGKSKQP